MPNLGYPAIDVRKIQDKIVEQGEVEYPDIEEIALEQAGYKYHVLYITAQYTTSTYSTIVWVSEDGGSTWIKVLELKSLERAMIAISKTCTHVKIDTSPGGPNVYYVLLEKTGYTV